ncbi:glycosyltransferase [Candidatus Marsarchaeota archaeon]|nr:glycosyltransferase [Candidatus Marsarchaeota archaeon]MCL5404515.1 glycosyltransferase [Candidatus Marsarchaeota archaeon]
MRNKLNIFFYTDTFLPAVDGAVTSMLDFKKALEQKGHRVVIVAAGNKKTKEQFAKRDDIIVVPGIKFRRYPQYSLALMPFLAANKIGIYDADIVHLQTPFMVGTYGMFAAKMSRMPIVGSFHTLFTRKSVIKEYGVSGKLAQQLFIKYAWPYARFFYTKCNKVIAPSMAISKLLYAKGIRNVNVVPNGVDMKRFNPGIKAKSLREMLLDGNADHIVLYVGRISMEKNIHTLIKAAKKLRHERIKFVVVGTGPAMASSIAMAKRAHIEDIVKFTGFVEEADLPKYYAASDLLCLPSTFETQGIVSLEAMATGKPVVGADYLALKEIIKNGQNGEKFRPMDYSDCADKIEKVINNLGSYKECIATARSYSVQNVTEKLISTYRQVIEGNARNKSSY